jgi:hypothetical protein
MKIRHHAPSPLSKEGMRVAEGAHNFTLFLLYNFIGVGRIVRKMYVMATSGRIQNDYKQTNHYQKSTSTTQNKILHNLK